MKVINNDYDMNSSHIVKAMGFQIAKKLGTVQNYFNIGKKGFKYNYSKLAIVVQPVRSKTNDYYYQDNVTIYYNYTTVFDFNENIFIKGSWTEIIRYIYEHLNDMIIEKNRKIETLRNMLLLLPKDDEDFNLSFDNIEINYWYFYEEYEPEWSECKYQRKLTGVSVYENEEKVLETYLKREHGDYIEIKEYTPGAWERKIDSFVNTTINTANQKKFEQNNNSYIEEDLNLLRKKYN